MEQVCNTVMIPREEYDALVQQRAHLERENAKQAELLNKVIEQRDELLAAAQPALEALEAASKQIAKLTSTWAGECPYQFVINDLIAAIAKVKP